MKKILCTGLIGLATLSLVGCGSEGKEPIVDNNKAAIENSVNKENNEGVTKTEDNNENGTGEKSDAKGEEQEKSNNESEVKFEEKSEEKSEAKADDKIEVKPENSVDKTERTFKITTKDSDYNIVKGEDIKTVGLGVADNIKKILGTISNKYFDNKTIELTTIENANGKKIAVVNLVGDENYWHQRMQGSAGGQVTQYTLIDNVLQKNYDGYWIDGVKFTLNGKSIHDNGHNSGLATTTYR